MTNSLNISAFVYSKLNTIPNVKTYPVIADNDAKFPFIIYRRIDLQPFSSKDGLQGDVATEEITIVTEKYSSGVQLAQQVRTLLEREDTFTNNNITMYTDTSLNGAIEDFQNNTYIQKLQFKIKIQR